MGKSLRGKELPKGISQRKDKKYEARFTTKFGKREGKTFNSIIEAQNWLAEVREKDRIGDYHKDMTVEEWYKVWIDLKRGSLKFNTVQGYENLYEKVLKNTIAKMNMSEVRAFHIQKIFNDLRSTYASSTLHLYKRSLSNFFNEAVYSDLIEHNPVTGRVRIPDSTVVLKDKVKVLTVQEQEEYVKAFQDSPYGLLYEFTLQTGLRVGEVCGLRWEDVDFREQLITVRQQVQASSYRRDKKMIGVPIIITPKSKTSVRDIPLTERALQILKAQRAAKHDIVIPEYSGYVFRNSTGGLHTTSTLNKALKKIAKKTGLPPISMHVLRHTFATRCAEANMKPKVLQMILGHSDISITMNVYTHVVKGEEQKEINRVAAEFKNWRKIGDRGSSFAQEDAAKLSIV